MTEIEKVTNNQAKARSIYNSLIKNNIFYTGISKNLAIALIELGIDSSTTDKLSVEKLIEKEIKDYEESYKISGRRSENYIAGILEGLKIARAHVIDSLSTDEKTVEKLQEQLNTAKKALTEISGVKNLTPFKKGFETSKAVGKARDMRNTARQALAAIGGDDD